MIYPVFGNNFITKRDKRIYLDEINAEFIYDNYKTPLFVFLKRKIVENIQRLNQVLDNVFEKRDLYYSVKSNYLPAILNAINEQGVKFSTVSRYELDILRSNNISTDEIIFGSPYLDFKVLNEIAKSKNPTICVYSVNQINILESFAQKHNIECLDVLLRVKSPNSNSHLGFYLDSDQLIVLKKLLDGCSRIRVLGILCHFGTQINRIKTIKKNSEYISSVLRELENRSICEAQIINLGGGLPIASSLKKERLMDYFQIQRDIFTDSGFSGLKVILEPGRYIIGDAGCCILRIVDQTNNKGKHAGRVETNLYLNGGLHILPRFSKNPLRFYNINAPLEHYNNPVNFYGIELIEQDVLAKNYNFTSRT